MPDNTTSIDRGASAETWDRARRWASVVSLAAGTTTILVGLAIVLIAESVPLSLQYLPLLVSVLVLGLPHGAVDHLVLPRAREEAVTRRSLVAIGVLYFAISTAYAVLWVLAPAAAFVLFILVTLFHWGQGDVYALVELTGVDYFEGAGSRVLTLFVRGGLPMLVPLVAFPEQYAFVAGTLVGLFDPAAAAALEPAFQPSVRLAVGIGFGVLVVATLGRGLVRSGPTGPWLIDAGETLGLVALFALVPPVLAIGLYFCFWHSLRHILRTMLVDDRAASALSRGALGEASRRFARDAAPLTGGAIVVLGGVALLVPRTPATVPDIVALYLVTIAILTLPHVVVVTALDREQGLWSPRAE
ncbi:Brp/Blh family beta-carotene 15,15'-dioxygenase [Natronorubrum sp. DTA28]|uniref:Brp/Blh family beta-carotene 15,15'-dioxygenase n=1 Tax=Natronorubrum sp. DTA28 TaxID=3447019 RepID=UPI003F863D75